MTIGRNIRALRRQKGLTQGELAALCGVSRDDLGKYERGEMTPRPRTVAKIAAALEIPITSIRAGIGWERQPLEAWEAPESGGLLGQGIREALGPEGAALTEADVQVLLEAVKASLPALVDHLKDQRPEKEVTKALLAELAPEPPFTLSDEQWAALQDLFPPEKGGRGRAFKSSRLMLEGVLWRLHTGAPWQQLPERYGRWRCVADRQKRWQAMGLWEPLLNRLTAMGLL